MAKKRIRRARVSRKNYVTRPSQITRSKPSKRLVSRRKRVDHGSGAFPNPTVSRGIALAKSAFTAASKTTDRRMLQARISYAQGINDALRACGAFTPHQSKVYLEGLRALLR
jgi:hypothetical protein